MKFPNVFIIGAPKCGTTALSDYLRGHPQVFMSIPKEPHYFAFDLPTLRRLGRPTLEAYLALFNAAEDTYLAAGEASVWYLYSRDALPEIARTLPSARFIAMVRNPIEMVHALHGQMLWSMREDEPDFERAWRLQDERRAGRGMPRRAIDAAIYQYREVGLLGAQLERAMGLVPKGSLKVIIYDDFVASPVSVYESVVSFLGLPPDERRDFDRMNASKTQRNRIVGRFAMQPPGEIVQAAMAIKRAMGIERLGVLSRLKAWNARPVERAPLSPAFRRELAEYFAPDVKRLGALLGRDLGHWLDV